MPNPKCLLSTVALCACLLLPAAVLAQADKEADTDGKVWVPVKHLTFTPEDIEGEVFTPEGERIETVLRADHPSLIELREGFEAEIVKTMEDM
jgi:hypothetical protein